MNHFISVSTAAEMTSLLRSQRENILKTEFQNDDLIPICETFDKEAFETLLGKSGCESLRIYYGMTENFKIHAIIVAVDENDADILPEENALTEGDFVAENGTRCPDLCPPSSPLNS